MTRLGLTRLRAAGHSLGEAARIEAVGPAPIAIGLGLVTLVLYLIGSDRPLGYDESATFAYAIATPDFFDALGGALRGPYSVPFAIGGNDQVLVSLVGHAIYSLTHTRAERVYRLFPIFCAATAVGVLGGYLRRRLPLLPSMLAAGFLAANPLYVASVRQVRGYGPAVLFCLLATILLLQRPRGVGRLALYGLLICLAATAHVVTLLVVPIHVVLAAVLQRHAALRLVPAWAAAVGATALLNGTMLLAALNSGHTPARHVDPTFLPLLPLYLLGGWVLVSLGIWLTVFLLGLAGPARNWITWGPLIATVLLLAVAAYVVQPPYLYPRFFLFLVPGAGYCIAVAIWRWPLVLGPAAALAIGWGVASEVPGYAMPEFPIKQAAHVADVVERRGGTACILPPDYDTMPAYTTHYRVVFSTADLGACDIVLLPGADADPVLKESVLQQFTEHRELPAQIPGWVLWRQGAPAPPVISN